MKTSNPQFSNPEYVQGTVDSIHAMILALASSARIPNAQHAEARRAALSMDAFHDVALKELQAVRDELTADDAVSARIDAVDAAIQWIRRATPA